VFGLSFEHLAVLVVAGLFILGPERLPDATAWLARSLRQFRDYATGARDQLRAEVGPELDELRKPLEDLQSLRGLHPTTVANRYLFGDQTDGPTTTGAGPVATPDDDPTARHGRQPLLPGQRPPFDPDAT
jgi:sec-independent protein translocase protein TatB